MEGEMNNFIKVWLSIIVSLCYCYLVGKTVPKGLNRLVLFIPIVCFFLLAPLTLSSINLSGGTAFLITWLGSLKLLLFAFHKGPLASNPQISLSHFLLISCLPIEISQNPSRTQKWPKHFNLKLLTFFTICPILHYKHNFHFHPKVNLVFLCLLIYLLLEIILALAGAMARAGLGAELEPHFNEPYAATSLHDFWGRRWNLVVSKVLYEAVYKPGLYLWAELMGRKWAPIPAVIGAFLVSGLFHELIYFYMSHVAPTWEVTWFFVLHGGCLAAEITAKKIFLENWKIPMMVSRLFTVGFVVVTSYWLFFPQFLRCEADVRLIEEYAILVRVLKRLVVH